MKKLISVLFVALSAFAIALPATAASQSGTTGAKPEAPIVIAAAKTSKVAAAKPAAKKPVVKAKTSKKAKAKAGAKKTKPAAKPA